MLFDPLNDIEENKAVISGLDRLNLTQYSGSIRLFHPHELLRLFGFPDAFSFPADMSLRQQYNCIGNSVNVAVVRKVMQHLFSKPLHCAISVPPK